MSQHYIDAFPTVFLPKDLPTKPLAEATQGQRNDRDSILTCWKDFLSPDKLEEPLFKLASHFVDLHMEGRFEQPARVMKSIKATRVGDYWGYHVRAQNAAVLVFREETNRALFMAWQVQSRNQDITNNIHIHQTFPQVFVRAYWEVIVANIENLCDLAKREQDLASQKTRKSGHEFKETRDVNNPFFVLDVFASMLGGEVISDEKCCVINKQICDEVRYMSSKLPWRRDPVYAVLKNVLHLVCMREHGSKANYKVMMLQFLTQCLARAGNAMESCSCLVEASRKIVRRMEKLKEQGLSTSTSLKYDLECAIKKATGKAMTKVTEEWDRRCRAKNTAAFDIPLETMSEAVKHTLPKSGALLERLSEIRGDISSGVCPSSESIQCPREFDRLRDWSPFDISDIETQTKLLHESLEMFGKAPQDFIGVFHDIIDRVFAGFEEVPLITKSDKVAVALLNLEERLIKVGLALGEYKGTSPFIDDVRSRSEVILAAFTICLLIDKIACIEYPLLTEHKLLGNSNVSFEKLFLPKLSHRVHLSKVEKYLAHREAGVGPPTLEAHRTTQSFAVRFATQSETMEAVRKEINIACQDLRREKLIEVYKEKEKFGKLMRDISGVRCSCGRLFKCDRCQKQDKANNICVSHHEKFLPNTLHEQQAVIFELQIPEILACQRDCFILFAESVCGEAWQEESDFCGYWVDDDNLSRWRNAQSTSVMRLGSTSKKVTGSHYRMVHITSHKDFIVDHGFQVMAMGAQGPLVDVGQWKWELSAHLTMNVADDRYYSLRQFFNSVSHDEKQVIAWKSEAHGELSLCEFEEVGVLRAGASLQLKRLQCGLEQEAYDLSREEIVSLICCVLWQVGPGSLHDGAFRKSALIISQMRDFSLEMCKALHRIVDDCETNWANNNTMLTVVYISRHLLEHTAADKNTEAVSEIVKVLRKCRMVAVEWINTLQGLLTQCSDNDACQSYRQRTVDIAVVGTLTFAWFNEFNELLKDAEDVWRWSLFRATFHDNYTPHEMLKESWRRPHLMYSLEVAEQVAQKLHAVLQTKVGQAGLSAFLKKYWSASKSGRLVSDWNLKNDSSNWFFSSFEDSCGNDKTIHFNVIGGSFLVEGSPCARLPKDICAHSIYTRLFDNAPFLVQPLSRGAYRTSCPVNGFYLEFYCAEFNPTLGFEKNPIIIKERSDNDERSVLLPDSFLAGDFPEILVNKYSHWFVLSSHNKDELDNMYFRPIKYSDLGMRLAFEKDEYVFCQPEKLLVEQRSGAHFLDVQSRPFKEMHDSVFRRLSPARFIHAKTCPGVVDITIELPRLNHSSFTYNGKCLQSNQFDGLIVAKDQNLGVFIGLQNGLLLEDPQQMSNRVFLCPNGHLLRERMGDSDVISIQTDTVLNPPFFRYTLREELQDLALHGQGRLGLLFLALLHGLTGDLKADPFTETTGTKRALDILRRGDLMGNLVLSTDEDTLRGLLVPEVELLGHIAQLSHCRKHYHGMEQVHTGSIPSLCAHDGFALLALERVKSIINALHLIGKAHILNNEVEDVMENCFKGRTDRLSTRSYFQRRKYYPEDCSLAKDEEKVLNEDLFSKARDADESHLKLHDVKIIQEIGFVAQNSEAFSVQQVSLEELLNNKDEIRWYKGNTDLKNVVLLFDNMIEQRLTSKPASHYVAFHDIWLQLYQIARCECRTNQGIILFGSLLTLVAAHYPNMIGYLHQLVAVAKFPDKFPDPLQHQRYTKTHEVDYMQKYIIEAISHSLELFQKLKPRVPSYPTHNQRRDYERSMKDWEKEKDRHNRMRSDTEMRLEITVKACFTRGSYITQSDMNFPLICNRSSLEEKLNALFDRWRQSKELKLFREAVSNQLLMVGSEQSSLALPQLVRVKTRAWPDKKFVLATESMSDTIHPDHCYQQRVRTIALTGRLDDAYENDVVTCSSSGEKQNPFTFYNHDGSHAETRLCESLALKLKESVNNALTLPEQSFKSLHNPATIVELCVDLLQYKDNGQRLMRELWKLLLQVKCSTSSLLPSVGLWNSTTPWNVLLEHFKPCNISQLKSTLESPFFSLNHLITAFAVLVKHVQRARRCVSLLRKGRSAYPTLSHDLASQGFLGWNPKEHPEFLAFEIDNDISIREQQAQVAKEILRNDRGNRLLQMNMGCGKSSVIMPLVLCVAADGESISRGTVLSSLYSTNCGDWQRKVGGLLSRQIFPLICSREINIDANKAQKMNLLLTTIKNERHLLVTVPEHRLSLENKAFEALYKKDYRLGRVLLGLIHNFKLVRDFVDESDEIGSPKYQLVYPLGSPHDLDGSEIRCLIHAAVLQSVSRHSKYLFDCYGGTAVEMVKFEHNDYQYSTIRLLNGPLLKEVYDRLCQLVVKDILTDKVPQKNGLKLRMKQDELDVWKRCVDGESIKLFEISNSLKSVKLLNSALILRGILSHEILKLLLQKRVRVEYGCNPFRPGYQLAVPYRYKDVPSKQSDFAHPDVCIGLTFATYYQCGLSEEQLLDVFRRLSRMSDASSYYSRWTEDMDGIGNLRSYTSVNLEDTELFRDSVFPLFRYHLGVIDFWLTKVVLPVQAKQYKEKITATAVDLFKSNELAPFCNAITTGFSGTDDLSLVLPPTVKQINMEELSATNGIQLLNILRPENSAYYALDSQHLSDNHTTNMILMHLQTSEVKANVVLDAGALVLHLSNEKFARAWLKQRTDCEACAFFMQDKVVYISKHDWNRVLSFSGSQFEADMSKCLLYLDDEHTRGSDFKLPLDARAVVTLGKGMNKDKLVQACMRMRQIGRGQQLAFVASHDVHLELEQMDNDTGSETERIVNIIHWTLKNTSKRICDLVPYFVNQAVCSQRKHEALCQHYYKGKPSPFTDDNDNGGTNTFASDQDLSALARHVTEPEQSTLMDMYIHERGKKTLINLTKDRLGLFCTEKLGCTIQKRVMRIAPDAERYCSLHDEEQEVELEHEFDEERQVERPPPAEPLQSCVSKELVAYFKHRRSAVEAGFQPLSSYFNETPFKSEIGIQLNKSLVFATRDFIKTVKGDGEKTFYLKRFRWFVQSTVGCDTITILISNFEAEYYARHVFSGAIKSFVPCLRKKQGVNSAAAELHVFGGSINAAGSALASMKSFLGLHPSETSEWNRLFEMGVIEYDGFVPSSERHGVSIESPFQTSIVNNLVRFLSDSRHIGGEIRTSVLGSMIEFEKE